VQQAVDLLGRQAVPDLLKPLGIGAAGHTIVEGLIRDVLPPLADAWRIHCH
jgi:hypothetical protein